ncbi:hypothetical protein ACFXPA_34855 [Amycolatopsis sp. NPDC059090]|uniref:hypothetical protein n=1 Tax=unclassified Amycolatopsis TaxID=2618356 RepID=UPI00366C2ECA
MSEQRSVAVDVAAVLVHLRTQVRVLAATMTVVPDAVQVAVMLADLHDTIACLAEPLSAAAPQAVAAIGRAGRLADHRRYDEACSELVHAHRILGDALDRDRPLTHPAVESARPAADSVPPPRRPSL